MNRRALLRGLQTDVAGLLEKVNGLDDFVVQSDGTDAGKRKRASIIVDSGTGHGNGGTTPTAPTPMRPTPAPAPASQ